MDKVIIDGVDVSGCNMKCDNGDCALYYAELNNDNNELIYGFNCSDNQDCYYKQLKRAKAENEQLKKSIDRIMQNKEIKTIDLDIAKENAELKAKNERLKEEMCSNCDFQKQYFVETKNLLDENKKLRNKICKERAETREDFEKIKQALQEIREIIETCLKFHKCEKCKFYKECQYDLEEYILAKINEVIGAE